MQGIDLSGQQTVQLTNQTQIAATRVTQVLRATLVDATAENLDVIVKRIDLDALYGQDEVDAETISKRLESLRTLQHERLCPLYDARLKDDRVQVIMPPFPATLAGQLPEKGFPVARVRTIFTALIQGLCYAHEAGVLHLNLKPTNVLIDSENRVCLSDFSIVNLPDADQRILFGTPAYLAPEQITRHCLNVQTDIYALACLLYTMLTGTPPFSVTHGLDEVMVLNNHLDEPPPPLSQLKSGLPASLDAVLHKALAKNPQHRYSSMAHFEQAVLSAIDHPDQQPVFTPPQGRLANFARPLIVALSFLMLVLASILLATQFNDDGETPGRKVVAQAQILVDERWTPEDIEVTDSELQMAHNQLGDNGFIAFIACNRTSEYYATIAREVVSFAANRNLRVTVYDAQNDPYSQPILIEQARVDGAVGFVVCVLDMAILGEPLQQLIIDELPIVLTSGTIIGAVMVRESDRLLAEPVGRYAGEFVRDELGGEANVVVLNYPQLPTLVEREEALVQSMLDIAPQAQIIANSSGGTRDLGYNSIQMLLETNTDFNVILSINDAGSYGAIEALAAEGIDPDAVSIFSVDAELQARQYIQQGYYLRASISAGRMASARAIVNSMVKLLAGSPIAERIVIPPGTLVTRENAE